MESPVLLNSGWIVYFHFNAPEHRLYYLLNWQGITRPEGKREREGGSEGRGERCGGMRKEREREAGEVSESGGVGGGGGRKKVCMGGYGGEKRRGEKKRKGKK